MLSIPAKSSFALWRADREIIAQEMVREKGALTWSVKNGLLEGIAVVIGDHTQHDDLMMVISVSTYQRAVDWTKLLRRKMQHMTSLDVIALPARMELDPTPVQMSMF